MLKKISKESKFSSTQMPWSEIRKQESEIKDIKIKNNYEFDAKHIL